MTSGEFHSILISSIKIDREGRQRSELVKIEELADSINRIGLINPIVITRSSELVAGERRLEACRSLGWTSISAQYIDELSEEELELIELEENVKRVDLPWVDQCKAVKRIHELKQARNPDWSVRDTATFAGYNHQTTYDYIKIADELNNGNKQILKIAEDKAGKISQARNLVKRTEERRQNSQFDLFEKTIAEEPQKEESILVADFNDWAKTYSGPRFNFIHCDFPYGVDAHKFNQSSAPIHGDYDDSEHVYWALLESLAGNLDRVAAESCHLVFWFSMRHYTTTMEFFAERTDFIIDPFPLIWFKSDGSGIIPDPNRGGRRVYETALFGRRGDRKIVTPVANAYAAPLPSKSIHMSEKSEPMLRHFFRMIVDDTTVMLDPTAGSGSSIRAAESFNAKFVLGLERNKEFAEEARVKLVQSREGRKV